MASSTGVNRTPGKSARGFASMDPERQRQIASQGGRASRANAGNNVNNANRNDQAVKAPPRDQ